MESSLKTSKPREKLRVVFNHRPTKAECANTKRDQVLLWDCHSPVAGKNGFVLTGEYPERPSPYKFLVVVDFDAGRKEAFLPAKWDLRPTYRVRTGSYGCHFYFWTDRRFANIQNAPITGLAKKEGWKGIDLRGEGGIIFLPGSKFEEHPAAYTVEWNGPIAEVSGDDLQAELDHYVFKISDVARKMRKGFREIWTGDWALWEDVNKTTGVPEWQYWIGFWREYLNVGGDLDTGCRHFLDRRTQFDFDEIETRRQLLSAFHLENLNKRPSNEFYHTLFPEYGKEKISFGGRSSSGTIEIGDAYAALEERIEKLEKFQFVIEKHFRQEARKKTNLIKNSLGRG